MAGKLRKVLILHASAGHGHLKAAEAVAAGFKASSDAVVTVEDALDYFPSFIKSSYVGSYVFFMKHAPWLWGILYAMSDSKLTYPITRLKRRIFNKLCARRLEKKLLDTKPDVVIATHFMPPEVISAMKAKGKLKDTMLVTVVTDYLVHRFWVQNGASLYCAGSRQTVDHLRELGVKESQIALSGIPIHPRFANLPDKEEAKKTLRLKEKLFTALFTFGGVGSSNVEHIIDELLKEEINAQLLVVCGSNKAMETRLRKKFTAFGKVKIYGFVDNMHELMAASDILVGKAGGLTVTEAIAAELPLFIMNPVPGQEVNNTRLLEESGAGLWVHNDREVVQWVLRMANDSEELAKMQKAAGSFAPRCSAANVVNAIGSAL